MKNSISKREFLKYCSAAAAGFALGSCCDKVFANPTINALLSIPAGEPGRYSKEALFYRKTANGLQCTKCPHGCLLNKGEAGICRNRVNYDNRLYSIAYGNPCAVHVDPIEKKPLFHFLPSTKAFSIAVAGCNLRCLNCQNWQISQFSPTETENIELMPDQAVAQCKENHCKSIAYTYSEPNTFYEYGYDTAAIARRNGIKNVWKSSGYINEEPLRRLCKVIDAANIDLKGFDERIYRKLNGASLAPVLRTLSVLKEEGVWLEVTNLVVPTWTDNPDMMQKMYAWLHNNGLSECPLHFSRFTPLYKLNQLPSTPVAVLEKARDIALKSGIKYVYIGNVPGHQAENTYCHACGRIVIERKGFTIVQNDLVEGTCKYCKAKIPGEWKG
ncbi:MAG: AmmeMemoRadiSam system radical SAM enzyme [Ignavibacteriales bacterium]|nr:AmmeMemoRadiSam system radical SAM enzyme [Ignavibacteriales bacterium]